MTKSRTILFLLFLILISLNSCKEKNQEEKTIEDVTEFATAYFNWDFPQASKYAKPEAHEWLSFLASQITEKDITAMKEKDEAASIEVEDVEFKDSNNSATTTISVNNYLLMDSIGKCPIICEHSVYTITMSKENKSWKCGIPILQKK